MLVYALFAAAIGLSVGVMAGPVPGLVSAMMLTGAGYAAKQVTWED